MQLVYRAHMLFLELGTSGYFKNEMLLRVASVYKTVDAQYMGIVNVSMVYRNCKIDFIQISQRDLHFMTLTQDDRELW
jgi:hypothetical protein